MTARDFLTESNHIEGIMRPPSGAEQNAFDWFMRGHVELLPTVQDVLTLQSVFAPNRPLRTQLGMDVRVYPRDERGRAIGWPTWRGHWVPHLVEGETARSWLLSSGRKMPKKGFSSAVFALSASELDDRQWVKDNAPNLGHRVHYCTDIATLKAIEALLSKVQGND